MLNKIKFKKENIILKENRKRKFSYWFNRVSLIFILSYQDFWSRQSNSALTVLIHCLVSPPPPLFTGFCVLPFNRKVEE